MSAWYRNKLTDVAWEVDGELEKRLSADPDFELLSLDVPSESKDETGATIPEAGTDTATDTEIAEPEKSAAKRTRRQSED